MMARPPPTRPHIVLNPSSRFSSYSNVEWGEDDAWDSASDSETQSVPRNFTSSTTWEKTSISTSAPKPVPKPARKTSVSSIAFSYTHVHAPSPSSYTPPNDPLHMSRTDWTLVGGQGEQSEVTELEAVDEKRDISTPSNDNIDSDELIIGEMDVPNSIESGPSSSKKKPTKDCVLLDATEVVKDPFHRIRHGTTIPDRSSSSSSSLSRQQVGSHQHMRALSIRANRRQKFIKCLSAVDVNMAELRKLAWNGIPDDIRPIAWPILLGYLPLTSHARIATLNRKREEYSSLLEHTFARGREGLDQQIWHQIEIDVPRTRPGVKLWMYGATQKCIERILYVWAIRHPASGYVQGINDLVTPFIQVFLSAYIDIDPEEFDPGLLPSDVLDAVEADSFWCLSRLLDGIQDNYISAQPGIQRSVKRMADLVSRIDAPLAAHLHSQNVEFMQFAFRWMNCLLMREISVKNTIRMWDTYLAEGPEAFSQFHLYVCSAFLIQWSKKLQEMDFQGIIMFLQSLPTQDWTDHEIEMLLSQAFVFNSTWHNAPSHFLGS